MTNTKTAVKKQQTPGNPNPNKGLGLEDFNYSEMHGQNAESKQMFEDYQKVTGKLLLNEKYDFEYWNAVGVYKYKVNEDTGEKEKYIAGIQLLGNKPIGKVTRISWLMAKEINTHVGNNATDRNSKYLLLAKPTV